MGGGLYYEELLDRIRDIRASVKVLYRQVLDLYATSIDYKASMPETIEFFKIVQNKRHFAVSGKTASEIIFNRANADLHFMGLTVFSGNRPVKSETQVAKNYMSEKELITLRRMVNAFFDMVEKIFLKKLLVKTKRIFLEFYTCRKHLFCIDFSLSGLVK